MRISELAFATLVAVSAVLFFSEADAAPHLETIDCAQFTALDPAISAECGYLVAPENRRAADSREIRIAFLRMRSSAAAPAPDPLVMMAGGPGSRGIHQERMGDHPVLASRDVIWIEQRGVGLSLPALDCPEYRTAEQRAARGEIRADGLARAQISAAGVCAARARAEGADLSGYTSTEMAADIDDLRRLLGYAQINFYGQSFSGRVMSVFARDFPASVRAIVLNSPLPVEVNYDEHGADNLRRTLDLVFASCEASAPCMTAAPNARTQFEELATQARRRPWRLSVGDAAAPHGPTEIMVTDWSFANAVLAQLYYPFAYERLPARIAAIHRGETEVLAAMMGLGGSDFAWLQRIAVWCNEEYPFEDQRKIRAQRRAYRAFGEVDQATTPVGVCEAAGFGDASPGARENAPVQTNVPTLIFAGEFDAATPPAWQEAMARHMSRSRLVVVRGGGHGAGFANCAFPMTLAFLDAPDADIVDTCAEAPSEVDFGRGAAG